MGAVWGTRNYFVTTLSETVGYKSGVALTREEMVDHLEDEHDWVLGDDDAQLRLRAEEYEDAVRLLLYRVGAISKRNVISPGISLFHRYRNDPKKLETYHAVMEIYVREFRLAVERAQKGDKLVDLTPFLFESDKKLGPDGLRMAMEITEETVILFQQSPWNGFREIDWSDQVRLKELFESEKLTPSHGKFIDQRFIAYLHRNFDSIDKINWRKFEGLTAEFFTLAGLQVDVGPGRNDGGIDVRVWPKEGDTSSPPGLLVQCKRQKEKVGKVVVKALWADVQHEKASSGLIVTTSRLSPGAKEVCVARAYPVGAAERDTLARWIKAMHKVKAGIFMGE